MMSHLIKVYAVCKFSYFRLWKSKMRIDNIVFSTSSSSFLLLLLHDGSMSADVQYFASPRVNTIIKVSPGAATTL